MDELMESQGSDQSPSTVQDAIVQHLNGGASTADNQGNGQPLDAGQTGAPAGDQGQQPGDAQQDASNPPQGRAEDRINELTSRNNELQRAYDAMQVFVASNPEIRNAYVQAFNPNAAQQFPQQAAMQQQGQPSGPDFPHFQVTDQERQSLPEWEPYDQDVVRQHAKVMMKEMLGEMMGPTLAPLAHALVQMQQQVVPTVQSIAQEREAAVQQQAVSHLDGVIFNEIPSAKDNDAHFAVANQALSQELAMLQQQTAQQYGRPPSMPEIEEAAKKAAAKAKTWINSFTSQQQTTQVANGYAQTAQPMFAEGATNLVQSRPNGAGTSQDAILAHLNRNK